MPLVMAKLGYEVQFHRVKNYPDIRHDRKTARHGIKKEGSCTFWRVKDLNSLQLCII